MIEYTMDDEILGLGIKSATVNGKTITYCNDTKFIVQLGKGKGKYTAKYTFVGNLQQAVFYYYGLNIGNGYKKRLILKSSIQNRVLAREMS